MCMSGCTVSVCFVCAVLTNWDNIFLNENINQKKRYHRFPCAKIKSECYLFTKREYSRNENRIERTKEKLKQKLSSEKKYLRTQNYRLHTANKLFVWIYSKTEDSECSKYLHANDGKRRQLVTIWLQGLL